MFGFEGGDFGDGGEDGGAVCCSPLETVLVVDAPVACLLVHVELRGIGEKAWYESEFMLGMLSS